MLGLSGLAGRVTSAFQAARGETGRRGQGHPPYDEAALPRTVFLVISASLVLFGLLMIYSSSSIMGLTSEDYNNNPAYFLQRQLAFVGVGLVFATILVFTDYHRWAEAFIKAIWIITVFLLVAVYAVGDSAYGATRWIPVGPFTLQPSEFAKITVVLVGARLCQLYFVERRLDQTEVLKHAAVSLLIPLALIFQQPDKGTTGVLLATLLIMCMLSGIPWRKIVMIGLAILVVLALVIAVTPYARSRIEVFLDPFAEEWGKGYQLVQSLYAFGTGGLKGVGLGFSRQKYNYLPMAHNDFIFAVIGEELGFVGVVIVLAAFVGLLWAGYRIAVSASDHTGRLIAAGFTSLLIIQLLINIMGVTGMIPLSGKPVPFISYGGSSVISCLMMVGFVTSVSMQSSQVAIEQEERRSQLRLAEEEEETFVGVPTRRSMRLASGSGRVVSSPSTYARKDWRVVDGGAPPATQRRQEGRIIVDSRGRRRLDLGPSASERLRSARRNRE